MNDISSTPLIIAKKLVKKFPTHLAVNEIDFEIYAGECFGFLGPNGAGKSSTLKMMYGLSPITQGSLTLFGQEIREHPTTIKKQLGVVPQEDSLDPDLTVFENLLVYARYFDLPMKEAKLRATELLNFLQLEEKKEAKITQLSGGMRRRLVITRALLNQPKILILDEPTTGLDPQARHLIWTKLRALKNTGVTLVLTTHYLEEAAQLCDRLVILNEGKILAQDTPKALIQNHVGREAYEIRGEKKQLNKLQEIALNENISTEEVGDALFLWVKTDQTLSEKLLSIIHNLDFHHRMANLEDVFLKFAGRNLVD